jgi:4-methoxybenzoate monooxygenase (O-demethylating)
MVGSPRAATVSIAIDSSVPQLDVDPYADEFLVDPYPHYVTLREAGPVVWLRPLGVYAVARHEEVATVLRDWETFTTRRGFGLTDMAVDVPLVDTPEYAQFADNPVMNTFGMRMLLDGARPDPPDNAQFRKVFTTLLAPGAVRPLRERFAAEAEEIVGRVIARGSFDAARELAEAYVLKMLCDTVGLPEAGREHLLLYGDMAMNTSGPRDRRYLDSIAAAVPAAEWVAGACQRDRLAGEGIGAQLFAMADAGIITHEDAGNYVRAFPTAGVDTTASTLANAIFDLIESPDQWQLLREDPSLARRAFQETMRRDVAPQPLFRTTTRSVELGGVVLEEGRKVLVLLGAANRDPRRFEDPDRFDIGRDASGHLGFGTGIHACPGQTLAMLEGECLLGALARQVERIELDGEPVRRVHNTLHTWAKLPVRVSASGHRP